MCLRTVEWEPSILQEGTSVLIFQVVTGSGDDDDRGLAYQDIEEQIGYAQIS